MVFVRNSDTPHFFILEFVCEGHPGLPWLNHHVRNVYVLFSGIKKLKNMAGIKQLNKMAQ